MGTISTGVGLMSGIDTGSLIESLLALDARAKAPIQIRIAQLSSAKAALLDINSSLLAFKTTSSAFRLNKVFQSVRVNSSNSDAAFATATGHPTPGSYSLLVKQLATTSQYLTRGFTSRDSASLGLDNITFELGNGRLHSDIDLTELNGGTGVHRGRISIRDRSGTQSEIDLTEVTTLQEVMDAINVDSSVQVTASISADGLKLTDTSGGAGSINVTEVNGGSTAGELGILGSSASSTLLGSNINSLGVGTALSNLNDGRGILIRDGVTDFILGVGATDYAVDLGRIDAPIIGASLLEKLNDGDGITINDDPDQGDLEVVASNGQIVMIDLGRIVDEEGHTLQEEVTTVQELLDRVNGALSDEFGAGQVTMSINGDANGFDLQDNLGGTAELEVRGAGPLNDATAEDLGILGSATGGLLSGSFIRNEAQSSRVQTIDDLIVRVRTATGGNVSLGISADGKGLRLSSTIDAIELKSGAPGFTGDAADIPDRTLADLGLTTGATGMEIESARVLSGMGSVLIDGLLGGTGLGGADSLTVTDRVGATTTLTGLSSFDTLSGLFESINSQLASAGVSAWIGLDDARIGARMTDTSGGGNAFSISGDLADILGIDDAGNQDVVDGGNLELQYVNQSTLLSKLNYGRGVGTGSFRLTDSTGATAVVDIGNDAKSLYDVMKLINTRGLAIRAEINANGDGLNIVDTTSEGGQTAVSPMKIEDISGAVATSLRIAGEPDDVGDGIDGTFAITVDLDWDDSIDDFLEKLGDLNAPVTATVLNTGAGAQPWHLNLTSTVSGRNGDLIIDTGGIDIGLNELVVAKDAKVFLGAADPENALLVRSSTNTLDNVIDDLEINLLQAGTGSLTIDISSDQESIVESVRSFVDALNEILAKIDNYDSYDVDTEVKGPLLGDSTVAQVRSLLYTTLQGSAHNIDGAYEFLSQVGINVGSEGIVELDEAKFTSALESDPAGMEELFAAFDSQTSTTEEIAPGIFVERDDTVYASLGFGELFDQLLAGLTDPYTGKLTRADDRFQTLLDSQAERIERIDERLAAKRTRLQRQFTAMEMALAQLQGQQSALLGLASNLNIAGIR